MLPIGFADAQGFLHASRVWATDRFVWFELVRSAFGFAGGIGAYWMSVRFMHQVGVEATEVQTVIWFAATIISVAVGSGRFGKWPLSDQLIAGAVIVGLVWLLIRTSNAH